MNFKTTILPLILLGVFLPNRLWATHNRAGEITYEQISDLSIRVTIVTYTRIRGAEVDRPQLGIYWGDGKRYADKARFSQRNVLRGSGRRHVHRRGL